MAGDWQKVEDHTPDKPEILRIAARTGLDPEVVFTKCFKLWRWAAKNTVDGVVCFGTAETLQATLDHFDASLFHRTGFCLALIDVGWLQVRSSSLVVPNFTRHKVQADKEPLGAAERQRRSRARRAMSQNVTNVVTAPMRRDVFARDNDMCVYCGFSKGDSAPVGEYVGAVLAIDHVIPRSKGGLSTLENLVAACSVCNNRKNGRTPEEAGMVARYVTGECDKIVTAALPRSDGAENGDISLFTEKLCPKSKEKKEPRKKVFVKPSLEEVKAYCLERGNGVDAQRFMDYYESVGWVVGKSFKPMKDWRAAIRNVWERNGNDGNGEYSTISAWLKRRGGA